MEQLTMNDVGRWRIRMSSGSVHVLEVEPPPAKSWVTRLSRLEASIEDVKSVDLRRDGERVELLGIGRLRVGEDGVMVLDVRRDGVQTIRATTRVVSIEEVL